LRTVPVSICQLQEAVYPDRPPFDPPAPFPELPWRPVRLDPANRIYPAVRESFRLLGLDAERYGSPEWNPLGDLIRPGERVVIKPNLVRDFHGAGLDTESLVTHGSVLRAVMDYALLALGGEGRLTVGDSPLQYTDFQRSLKLTGADSVIRDARERSLVPVEAVDFRKERSEKRRQVIVSRISNDGDPRGYREIELGDASRFRGLEERCPLFRVTQYNPALMRESHNADRHAYLFPSTILEADVILNLPKMKTHGKAGITAAMKNLVGINGSKDWLPHHSFGSVAEGGDEYLAPSARKRIISRLRDRMETATGSVWKRAIWLMIRAVLRTGRLFPFPDPYFEGSWYGNDTIWRTVHDLHRALFYADGEGLLTGTPQRRYLALIDGVVAGEGEGPMNPTPKGAALLVASASPLAADLVCARLMGFDERKVPLLNYGIGNEFHPPLARADDLDLRTNDPRWENLLQLSREETLAFMPPPGWLGHVELDGR
jgi:uncharacterized protein (DUF362 family)